MSSKAVTAASTTGSVSAALYNTVWISAVLSVVDVLQRYRTPPIFIAALCVCASLARSMIG